MTGIIPKRILEVSFLMISHDPYALSGLSFLPRATTGLNHSFGVYLLVMMYMAVTLGSSV